MQPPALLHQRLQATLDLLQLPPEAGKRLLPAAHAPCHPTPFPGLLISRSAVSGRASHPDLLLTSYLPFLSRSSPLRTHS